MGARRRHWPRFVRVPAAIGDFLILEAVRDSGGFATAVTDAEIFSAQQALAGNEGMLLCPEGAATAAALVKEVKSGRIQRHEKVVLFNCATGLKYPMPEANATLDISKDVDYGALI